MASAGDPLQPAPARPNVIINLQLLRGIAATMVMFVHLETVLRYFWGSNPVRASMFAGVDIFFVISGFIMVFVTERRLRRPSSFLLDRVIRIVPIYWFFTFVTIAVAAALPGLGAGVPPLDLIAKSLLFMPYGDPPRFPPILYVGWSLNAEMVFYLLFSLSLALAPQTRKRWLITAAAVVAILCAGRLAPPDAGLRFYGEPIMLEFILGMALAYWRRQVVRVPVLVAAALTVLGAAAILITPIVFGDVSTFFLFGVPAAAIVAGLIALEHSGHCAPERLAVWAGAISYILYITHPLVISAFNNIQERVAVLRTPAGALVAALVAIAAALVFATLANRFLEVPVARWLKRRCARLLG
jgi:exopolysaccharide production protein ExoZ